LEGREKDTVRNILALCLKIHFATMMQEISWETGSYQNFPGLFDRYSHDFHGSIDRYELTYQSLKLSVKSLLLYGNF
jgi:hypothetical protein